jgi:ABC-2 type transport system ATP-binding protein
MKSLLKTLNSETFVLYLRESLVQLPDIRGSYQLRLSDEHTLEVDIPKAETLNDLILQLHQAGIQIDSMRNKVNRLEELFVSLIQSQEREA